VTHDREERLRKLAEAVADGRQVNWQQAMEEAPDSSDGIQALRVIEALAAAHTPVTLPPAYELVVLGRTLEEILIERGPFGEREAAAIGIELCRALAEVHAKNHVHGGVRTQNVVREEGGRIHLMDAGSPGTGSVRDEDTAGRKPYSTPLVTAPEVLGAGAPTPRSDIYSLGVLLFRLVTGRYPIEAATYEDLVEKHRRRDRLSLRVERPDLSATFVRAVDRALEPDPRTRYSAPGAMERALLQSVRPASAFERAFGWLPAPWRGPAVAAAGLLLVAGFVATGRTLAPAPVPPPARVSIVEKGVLTAHATLYRDRGLELPAEQLMPGARVSPGDALFLELWGEDSMSVYVLHEDARGRVHVLFPLPGSGLGNPLPAMDRRRLPGARGGAVDRWRVASIGEREDLIVFASRTPLRSLEEEIAGLPIAGRPGTIDPAVELSPGAAARLRRIGGTETAAEPAAPEQGSSRLAEVLGAIASEPDRARDVWVWQTKLGSAPTP
jgi:hypothetical protein